MRNNLLILGLCLFMAACSSTPDTSGLPDEPVFASSSSDEVLLRYHFKPGQKSDIDVQMNIDNVMSGMGRKLNIGMKMRMEGYYKVRRVDANNTATIDFFIKRIRMSTSGVRHFSLDTDNPSFRRNRRFSSLGALLKTAITARITELGKLESIDLKRMKVALRHSGSSPALTTQMTRAYNDIARSSFVPLPQKAVKKGDIYDAGTIVQTLDKNLGSMHMKTRYKVIAVSADKKQVLLLPLIKIKMNTNGPVSIDMKDTEINGWILFDTAKGTIPRSSAVMKLQMGVEAMGNSLDMVMTARVKYFAD
jgi:hypothetical protein